MRLRSAFGFLALCVVLGGCGGRQGSPGALLPGPVQPAGFTRSAPAIALQTVATAATLPNVAGTYTGTIDDAVKGTGTLTIVLNQNGSKLSGTFTPVINGKTGTANFTGKVFVSKGKTKIKLSSVFSKCSGSAKGYVTKTHHLNGSYTATCPAGSTHGTFKTIKS
jgi:hypothetical protein